MKLICPNVTRLIHFPKGTLFMVDSSMATLLNDHHHATNTTTTTTTNSNRVHHHPYLRHDVAVIMVPLPAQGHLNQLLHLSHLISSSYPENVAVHYAAASTHIRQAQLRLHGHAGKTNIHFHKLTAPSFPSPPPLDAAAAASTKFPSHLQPTFEAAALHLRGPIAALLRSLSATAGRLVVIHDSLMASTVQDFSSLPNASSFSFHSVSASASLSFRWSLSGTESLDGEPMPSMESVFSPEFVGFIETQHKFLKLCSGKLYNTCGALEAPFIKLLQKEEEKRVWAIGPFNPVSKPIRSVHKCLEWLDKQPARSVLYVSFGTTTSMERDQIEEVAIGLEKSEQKFIWVLRAPDRGDILENSGEEKASLLLPDGFEERAERGGMGMVVREWAPQLDIMGHPGTGGFMSHCGWNSCVESLGMGVPIAAWPMHSDQPRNATLVVNHLKVGVMVREWATRHQIVTRHHVEEAVLRLMASEDSDEMRRRAGVLGGAVRESAAEGGASRIELDSFIAHITRPVVS